MKRALLLLFALLGAIAIACGGGDDDGGGDDGGSDSQPTAAATDAGGGDADGDSDDSDDDADDGDDDADDGGGSATVTAGDETFTFTVECSFGTGIIRGAGSNADGTPTFLQASMPKNSAGSPANNPAEVGINVWIGRDELIGPSTYEYVVSSTAGSTSEYTDDGSSASGTVQFQYREKDGAKEGLTDGDLVDGSFEATCP